MRDECQEAQNLLTEYIDDHLDHITAASVYQHLRQCQICREIHQDITLLTQDLNQLPDPAPPPDLKSIIQERARQEGLLSPVRKSRPTPTWHWLAAVAAVFVVAILTWQLLPPQQPVQTQNEVAAIYQDLEQAESLYLKAIGRMSLLAQDRLILMPEETRQTFESSLQLIDSTIAQSRTYLLENRRDPRAWEYLLAAYQKKVEFLGLIMDTDTGL